jgi:outer membrane protein assembly factor BamD
MKNRAKERGILWLILALVISLGGCGYFTFGGSKEWEKTPEQMVDEGLKSFEKKRYSRAAEDFQKVKDRFPYSRLAILAELKLADSYYFDKNYLEASVAYQDFEKMHPQNEVIPYVIYMLGMSYFNLRGTYDRDSTNTEKAVQEFKRLIETYPKDENVPAALKNLELCRQELAKHEFYIAEFYFKQKKYQAALDRLETLGKNYPSFVGDKKYQALLESTRKMIQKASQKN